MILLVMVLTPLVKRHEGVGEASDTTLMDNRTSAVSASDMEDR